MQKRPLALLLSGLIYWRALAAECPSLFHGYFAIASFAGDQLAANECSTDLAAPRLPEHQSPAPPWSLIAFRKCNTHAETRSPSTLTSKRPNQPNQLNQLNRNFRKSSTYGYHDHRGNHQPEEMVTFENQPEEIVTFDNHKPSRIVIGGQCVRMCRSTGL